MIARARNAPTTSTNVRIRPSGEWGKPNEYTAVGECPNCNDKEYLLILKGTALSKVKILCRRCEAANLRVRP